MATDKEQDQAIQSLSVITKDLQSELNNLKQTKTVAPSTTTQVATPTTPGAVTLPAMPPAQAGVTTAMPPMAEPSPAVADQPVKAAEPAKISKADTTKVSKTVGKDKFTGKFVRKPVSAKGDQQAATKLQVPTTKPSAGADVIQLSTRKAARQRATTSGLDQIGDEPFLRTGTEESIAEEATQSPVIGSMVQQLQKPSVLKQNHQAFKDAYGKIKDVKLNYGGSANIPLTWTTMDGIVSTLSAFAPEQQREVWTQLFTDPNYLRDFLNEYVPQRGLLEADVIPLAQRRESPDQLKAYNRALEIIRAARDPSIPDDRVTMLKQALFKDFGTRIQQAPDGHYYMTFQGKQIPLAETKPSTIVNRAIAAGKALPKIDARLQQHQQRRQELERLRAKLDAELARKDQEDQAYWAKNAPRADRIKPAASSVEESAMGELDAMRQDLEHMTDRQFYVAYGISKAAFQQRYRTLLNPAPEQDAPVEEGSLGGSGLVGLKAHYAVYKKENGKVSKVKDTNKAGGPMNPLEAEAYADMMIKNNPTRYNHDNVWTAGADIDLDEGWKSALAGAALAGATALGAPATHAGTVQAGALQQALSQQLKKPALPQPQAPKEKEKADDSKEKTTVSQTDVKEAGSPAQQAAIAIAMKKAHKKPMDETPTDYQKRRQRERDVDAGRPVKTLPKNPQTDYARKRAKDRKDMEMGEATADQFGQAVRMASQTGKHLEKDPETHREIRRTQQQVAQRQKNIDRRQAGYGNDPDEYADIDEEFVMPGTTIPHKSVIRGYVVYYNPQTQIVSVTRRGESEEAAIDQIQIKKPSMQAFDAAVTKLINAIEQDLVEAAEIRTKNDFIQQRDKLYRMIQLETDPANKQILKTAIRNLERRAAEEGWFKLIREENSTSSEAVEIALIRRVLVAHTDLIMEFGLDKVTQAIEEVAYNVGDVDEIGSSDVSAWIHQVKQILGVPEELDEKWSQKYKSSINCAHPRGFGQKAHCAGRKK